MHTHAYTCTQTQRHSEWWFVDVESRCFGEATASVLRDTRGRSRWCRWSFSVLLLSNKAKLFLWALTPCHVPTGSRSAPLNASQLASGWCRGGRSATQRPQRETSESIKASQRGVKPPPTPSRVYTGLFFTGKWTQHSHLDCPHFLSLTWMQQPPNSIQNVPDL